jgi:mono/diheme cytochrome c family protein
MAVLAALATPALFGRAAEASYHETHEWDPAVLNDGRIVYTRWDYVDRHAVYYQQLWTMRPDGSNVRAFYGNHTLNPVGVWEARPVPDSHRVMATAAAHHAMTAGSIVLIDVARGCDGESPITRLTPDALFPESEAPVAKGGAAGGAWHAPAGVSSPPPVPPEAARWPGHCYRTPWPLSERYFLAAYSFDPLIGEPGANPPNQFGLYLVDVFGNKELLYRDPEISSLWPVPLRPRSRPPVYPKETSASPTGTFFLQDIRAAWPGLPETPVRRLRILQVLPKTTPHINDPPVGLANASPGRQVLGTVPVEADGSASFRAPAGIALAFQALDERGQAVQTMRSTTYLQPGETASCVGCHDRRSSVPEPGAVALALKREPSEIVPGPDGSRPLSYPILMQPVLDRHCVGCHGGEKPRGGISLTGVPQGRFTVSYNVLAPRVSFAAWGGKPGDFRDVNSEPMTRPDFFGARGSPLMKMLLGGHHDVALAAADVERLVTWMDANALFYGTFDKAAQARQQRGERIEGPALE